MLDCLHLVRELLRTKPNILQPKHSQYKRTPCLIWNSQQLHMHIFLPPESVPSAPCEPALSYIQRKVNAFLAWRGVDLRECVLSREVFIKASKRKPSNSVRLKFNANFTTWNWPPTNVSTTIARDLIGQLSRNVGEITRHWAAGYNPNKICCISLRFIHEDQISVFARCDWQANNWYEMRCVKRANWMPRW